MSIFRDIGAQLSAGFALIPVVTLSSGLASTAAAEVNGPAFDRFTFSARHLSASLLVPHEAILTSGIDAAISANMQHSDTTVSTDFSDLGSSTHTVSYTGTTGAASTWQGVLKVDVDMTMAKRYLRAQVTPALGTTTTGKALRYGGLFVFGSADQTT